MYPSKLSDFLEKKALSDPSKGVNTMDTGPSAIYRDGGEQDLQTPIDWDNSTLDSYLNDWGANILNNPAGRSANNWGNAGAVGGAITLGAAGAAAGSVVPGIGTALGGLVGSAIGGTLGFFGGGWAGKQVGERGARYAHTGKAQTNDQYMAQYMEKMKPTAAQYHRMALNTQKNNFLNTGKVDYTVDPL